MNYAAAPIKTTTLNRALMLAALVGVGACGGGDDPANVVTNEKAAACQPSPGDAVHVGLVCLKLDDLFSPAKIAAAKAAYAENAAIVLEGGTLSQLRTALGFPESAPSAESVPAQAPTTTGLPVAPSTDPLASLSTDMAGIALLFDGSVSELEHQSNQMLELFGDAKGAQDALAEWWPTRRLLRPSTAGEGWSQQLSRTHAVSSDAGNLTSVVSTYRLNGKDKLFDYFMVANTMVASAKYGVCDSPFSGRGKIGHYTWLRETFLYNAASSALPTSDITVFETQPGTSVGSNSEGWSIGANLGFNASGPTGGISAGYSQSYSVSEHHDRKARAGGHSLGRMELQLSQGIVHPESVPCQRDLQFSQPAECAHRAGSQRQELDGLGFQPQQFPLRNLQERRRHHKQLERQPIQHCHV